MRPSDLPLMTATSSPQLTGSMRPTSDQNRIALLALLLGVVVIVTFIPLLNNDFIRYDDRAYVTENSRVLQGVTLKNILWTFKTSYSSNWHPLTWISHMVDVQLFGL